MEIKDLTARFSSYFHNFAGKMKFKKKPSGKIRKTRAAVLNDPTSTLLSSTFSTAGSNDIGSVFIETQFQ